MRRIKEREREKKRVSGRKQIGVNSKEKRQQKKKERCGRLPACRFYCYSACATGTPPARPSPSDDRTIIPLHQVRNVHIYIYRRRRVTTTSSSLILSTWSTQRQEERPHSTREKYKKNPVKTKNPDGKTSINVKSCREVWCCILGGLGGI